MPNYLQTASKNPRVLESKITEIKKRVENDKIKCTRLFETYVLNSRLNVYFIVTVNYSFYIGWFVNIL